MPEPVSHPVGVLYEIRWREICPWLLLVKSLRVALFFRVLFLSTVGVFVTQLGWDLLLQVVTLDTHPSMLVHREPPALEWEQFTESLTTADFSDLWRSNPLFEGWKEVVRSFLLTLQQASALQAFAGVLHGLWAIAVWALFGGAIARIAALYLTRGQTLGPGQALRDAATIWPSTFGSPIIVLLGGLGVGVPLALLGLLLRSDILALFAAILWGLTLAWGMLLAIVLVGFVFGWPLMWACLGVERSDAFDGVSRCYAYVYQRPFHLAFYLVFAGVLSQLGQYVVEGFAIAATALSEWTLSWGTGNERLAELLEPGGAGATLSLTSRVLLTWKHALVALVDAYPWACLWAMAVGVYLLLRLQVDATELDEVKLSDSNAPQGLPPLQAKESGVPAVERGSGESEDS